jgi:transposase
MRLDVDTVQDVALLRQVIHLQEAENARLHKRIEELVKRLCQMEGKSESAALQLELVKLSEQLATLQHKMYGSSSEKQPRPCEKSEAAPKPKRTGHGPTAQPELPHVEKRHELSESERTCPLCQKTMQTWLGQTEDSEEISVIERRFIVTTHKRQKYRCACNAAILTAPAPLKLIEGGRYSLEFAVEVAVQKYAEHLPLDRQVRQMRRQGLVVTSQTLWDQIYALSCVLRPAYEALPHKVLGAEVVHADETTWRLLEKRPSKLWYVWGLTSRDGTYYHFDPSRSAEVLRRLLSDFRGIVMSDGYPAYQTLARASPHIALVFCWAHVRRKFHEALPAYPQCQEALDLICALYQVERKLPAYESLDGEARAEALALRTTLRKQESAPLVVKLQAWAGQQSCLPQSSLRKAIQYMQHLWPGLVRFVEDGRIPLDNNAIERDLRGVCVGRKNHYGSKSERGTKVAALLYSLIETAKHLGLNEQTYLLRAAEHALKNPGSALLPHDLLE